MVALQGYRLVLVIIIALMPAILVIAFLCFRKDTFEHIGAWLEEVVSNSNHDNMVILLVGNKRLVLMFK